MKKLYSKYKTSLDYTFIAILSFVIDIIFYSVFLFILEKHLTNAIILASFLARFISSLFNSLMNKYKVFKSKKNIKTLFEYFVLVLINITISAFLVNILSKIIPIYSTIIKIVVDLVIFIFSYIIQKYLIFNK